MPEEPREPGRDRGAVSRPGEELAYVVNQLVQEFPGYPRSEISSVVETAKVEIAPSIDAEDLLTRARERLRAREHDESHVGAARPQSAQPFTQGRKSGPSRAGL